MGSDAQPFYSMTWRIIGNEKGRALEWLIEHLPPDQKERPDFGKYSALIHQWDLDIRAVVLYNEYHPANSCDMHIAATAVAGQQWLTRPFLAACFRYPFIELQVRRVTAKVAANNAKIIRLIEHLGFVREGCAREAYDAGVDLLIFGMLRSECRYLETKCARAVRIQNPRRTE